MCFDKTQPDWKKLASFVLGNDTSIPVKEMMLKVKQEHQIYKDM